MNGFNDFGRAIAIITSNRPSYLESLARSVGENLLLYGHNPREWPLLVVDNSSLQYSEQNILVLEAVRKEYPALPIFYLGAAEFEKLVERGGESFRQMFSGHGCPDLRNLATMACTDKIFILLDDDMSLTESALYEKSGVDYNSLLSTGRFIPLDCFSTMSYKRPFDLVKATTSELGKKASDVPTISERRGLAIGNRDKTIDLLMGDITNGNGNYCFCHIEPGDIDMGAVIKWQGLAAVTEKADCHATSSIQGLSMVANGQVEEYGNLFVNYAIHDREPRIGLASEWKESSMAAFGILNIEPLPSYPLPRNEDVAYRHMISPSNPIALSSFAVDHNRSLTGRPRLSLIYYNEIMGAKICRSLRETIDGNWWNLDEVGPLEKDQKRDVLRSMKKTCAILDVIRKNGNPDMVDYSNLLIQDIANAFSSSDNTSDNNSFWNDEGFKQRVFETSEDYFERAITTTKDIFENWPRIIEHARQQGIPLREFQP